MYIYIYINNTYVLTYVHIYVFIFTHMCVHTVKCGVVVCSFASDIIPAGGRRCLVNRIQYHAVQSSRLHLPYWECVVDTKDSNSGG